MKDSKIKYYFRFTILNSSVPLKNSQDHHIYLAEEFTQVGGRVVILQQGCDGLQTDSNH